MSTRAILFFASSIFATLPVAVAHADEMPTPTADRGLLVEEEAPHATDVARQGQLLPQTFSATIGHKQVIGVFLGGYDSAPQQGPQFSALVEGQLFNRVALRVGVDYQDGIHNVYPSVGVRVGLLRQERYKVDLGLIGQYKNLGFSEASGEFELGVLVGHRWGKLGGQLNALYGQGLDAGERDAEVRASLLWYAHRRLQAGLDMRARIDLGTENPARAKAALQSDFDFLGGAIAQLTVVEHLVLMAEVGPHVVVIQEKAQAGAAVLAGVGATY
ncbi:MAG: hypothetical protein JWM53_2597 [bacterium]|nr:hypothetical protein [bacterium]